MVYTAGSKLVAQRACGFESLQGYQILKGGKKIDPIEEMRERIDYIILSQPEHVTPLQQVERVQKVIDQIIDHTKKDK